MDPLKKDGKYRFRRHDNIGAVAAEDDEEFLRHCFVDSEELSILRDCQNPRTIVVGRTGSGKSALLLKIAESESRAITLHPEDLALTYLTNSNILRLVATLEVNVDTFLRLLWRHALIVEILRRHFEIYDTRQRSKLMDWLGANRAVNDKHKKARSYLETWSDTFWEGTAVRIKEFVNKLEKSLSASLGGNMTLARLNVTGAGTLSQELRAEFREHAQRVVDEVQIRELSEVMNLLNDILGDRQKRYYVVIDGLDEDWIEDGMRLRLVRALIETARDFRKVNNVKVIVALRTDLLERVFEVTRDAGFQREKYQSLLLDLQWTKSDLNVLLNRRINHMIRKRYEPRGSVALADLLPQSVKRGGGRSDREEGVDFILNRTLMRPRDAIAFINSLISAAEGRADFSADNMRSAEAEYSASRLDALLDEWRTVFPNLKALAVHAVGGTAASGSLEGLGAVLEKLSQEVSRSALAEDDQLAIALDLYYQDGDAARFARSFARVLYIVGLMGLKPRSVDGVYWACLDAHVVNAHDLSADSRYYIHPCFWRALGIAGTHSHFAPT